MNLKSECLGTRLDQHFHWLQIHESSIAYYLLRVSQNKSITTCKLTADATSTVAIPRWQVWVRDYLATQTPFLPDCKRRSTISSTSSRLGRGLTTVFEPVGTEMEKYKPERDLPEGTYADSLRQLQGFRIVGAQKRCITVVGTTSRGPDYHQGLAWRGHIDKGYLSNLKAAVVQRVEGSRLFVMTLREFSSLKVKFCTNGAKLL